MYLVIFATGSNHGVVTLSAHGRDRTRRATKQRDREAKPGRWICDGQRGNEDGDGVHKDGDGVNEDGDGAIKDGDGAIETATARSGTATA